MLVLRFTEFELELWRGELLTKPGREGVEVGFLGNPAIVLLFCRAAVGWIWSSLIARDSSEGRNGGFLAGMGR